MKKNYLSLLLGFSLFASQLYASTHGTSVIEENCGASSIVKEENPESLFPFMSLPECFKGEIIYKKHIHGGTGGVHVVEAGGKKFVVKSSVHHGHGVTEALARYLMDSLMEHNSLENQFFVSNTLPEALQKVLPSSFCHNKVLFSIAPFISSSKEKDIKTHLREHFVLLSLLAYWDMEEANIILDKNKKLHIIDTGGSFHYRAWGQLKAETPGWSASYISELQTLPDSRYVFKDITVNALKAQIKPLIDKSSLILSRAETFCLALKSTERFDIVSMLSNRLQHLSDLYDALSGTYKPRTDGIKVANSYDTAGTLCWSIDPVTQKPVVLLVKKFGKEEWEHFKYQANSNEFLHETASRISQTYPLALASLSPQALYTHPSHDDVSWSNHIPTHHRTYLSRIPYSQISDNMDPQTHYAWVSIENIYQTLKDQISKGDMCTLNVGAYTLDTSFVNVLQQTVIQDWLYALVHGQPIANTHTQSVKGLKPLEDARPHQALYNPNNAKTGMILSFMNAKQKTDHLQTSEATDTTRPCLSDYMLKILAEQKNISPTLSEDNTLKALYPAYSHEQRAVISNIIRMERQYPDHYVAYHGLNFDVWFAYRVLSYIKHFFNNTALQTDVLRSHDGFFNDLPTIHDIKNTITEEIDDTHSDLLSVCMSCNPTLFSNYNSKGEETLNFFFKNYNYLPPDTSSIITALFRHLGIPPINFKELLTNFKKTNSAYLSRSQSGALLQFFIPKPIINETTYVSKSFGYPYPDNVTLDKLCKQDHLTEFHHNNVQLRLHARLKDSDNIIVKDYLANGMNINALDEAIHGLLQPYMNTLGNHMLRYPVYQDPIYLQQTLSILLNVQLWENPVKKVNLGELYLNNKWVELKKIYMKKDYTDLTYLINGTLDVKKIDEEFLKSLCLLSNEEIEFLEKHIKPYEDYINLSKIFNFFVKDKINTKKILKIFKEINDKNYYTFELFCKQFFDENIVSVENREAYLQDANEIFDFSGRIINKILADVELTRFTKMILKDMNITGRITPFIILNLKKNNCETLCKRLNIVKLVYGQQKINITKLAEILVFLEETVKLFEEKWDDVFKKVEMYMNNHKGFNKDKINIENYKDLFCDIISS